MGASETSYASMVVFEINQAQKSEVPNDFGHP